jgi:hypothetical protein
MKPFLLATFIFSLILFSCNPLETKKEDPESESSVTKKHIAEMDEQGNGMNAPSSGINPLLVGKWQVDSSGFINNDVQKPMEAPLVDTYWEFTGDGKLIFSGNISYTSNITIVDNAFKVNMGGTELNYRIKSLSENSLVLLSTIVDTKEMKMESIAKLRKVK